MRRLPGVSGPRRQGDVSVATEQVEVGVDVVIGGDGIEDEVQAASVLLHLLSIGEDDDPVGTQAERVLLLAERGGENNDVGSEGTGEFHAHVTQPAETDYANFVALCDAPAAHGRVCCDPGAEERRGSGEIEIGRDAQDEVFIDDDAVGVSVVGDAPEVFVRRAVGEGLVWAELLMTSPALGAGAVRIDQATDARKVAQLELGDCGTDLGDPADDLVARHARVNRGHRAVPLVASIVKIGVTDAAEEDLDLHVVLRRIASRDRAGSQQRCRTGSGVSFGVKHGIFGL